MPAGKGTEPAGRGLGSWVEAGALDSRNGSKDAQVLIPGLLHDKWEPRLLICSLQNREITLDFGGGPQATGVLRRGREAEASQRDR